MLNLFPSHLGSLFWSESSIFLNLITPWLANQVWCQFFLLINFQFLIHVWSNFAAILDLSLLYMYQWLRAKKMDSDTRKSGFLSGTRFHLCELQHEYTVDNRVDTKSVCYQISDWKIVITASFCLSQVSDTYIKLRNQWIRVSEFTNLKEELSFNPIAFKSCKLSGTK